MKKRALLIFALALCCSMTLLAQHGRVSYQAVVRDSTNHLVVNTQLDVDVKLTDSVGNYYSESHLVTSNPNGMMSLWIGDGTSPSGNWDAILWDKVKVESKIYRHTDGKHIVTHVVPIAAVPYALYAENVNDGPLFMVADADTTKFTANQADTTIVNLDTIVQKLNYIQYLEQKIADLEVRVYNLEHTSSTFVCGTDKAQDNEGNWYETQEIGSQCWMKTNLRAKTKKDGTPISDGGTTSFSATTPYYYHVATNDSLSGYFYNWNAAQDACPPGWSLPTGSDYATLNTYLQNHSELRCGAITDYVAKALASKDGWKSATGECAVGNTPNNNNSTGFSAYPAGELEGTSAPTSVEEYATFWYSNAGGSACFYLRHDMPQIYYVNSGLSEQYAYSVRCIRK